MSGITFNHICSKSKELVTVALSTNNIQIHYNIIMKLFIEGYFTHLMFNIQWMGKVTPLDTSLFKHSVKNNSKMELYNNASAFRFYISRNKSKTYIVSYKYISVLMKLKCSQYQINLCSHETKMQLVSNISLFS